MRRGGETHDEEHHNAQPDHRRLRHNRSYSDRGQCERSERRRNRTIDRDDTASDVSSAAKQAGKVYQLYGASDKLEISSPWDYNRLTNAEQDAAIKWLTSAAASGATAINISAPTTASAR